jgi:hypothetical protein
MCENQFVFRTIQYFTADPLIRLAVGTKYYKRPTDSCYIYETLSNLKLCEYITDRLRDEGHDVVFESHTERNWNGHTYDTTKYCKITSSSIRGNAVWFRKGSENLRDCIGSFVQRRRPWSDGRDFDPHTIYRIMDAKLGTVLYLTTAKDRLGNWIANTAEYLALHPEVVLDNDGFILHASSDLLIVEDDGGFTLY